MRAIIVVFVAFAFAFGGVADPPTPPFKRLWTFCPDGPILGYFVTGERICYITNTVYGAIRLSNGTPLWSVPTAEGNRVRELSLFGGHLYLTTDSKTIEIRQSDGAVVEKSEIPVSGFTHCNGLLIGSMPNAAYGAVSAKTHHVVWKVPSGTNKLITSGPSDPPILSGGKMFAAALAMVWSFDPKNGRILWTYRAAKKDAGTGGLAAGGGRAIFLGSDGQVTALNARSGKRIWSILSDIDPSGAPFLWSGLVILVGREGRVQALDPATGRKRWMTRLSDKMYDAITGPQPMGNKLLVGFSSRLAALDSNGKVN
jgi:outer membrane protein assembly factor BamB